MTRTIKSPKRGRVRSRHCLAALAMAAWAGSAFASNYSFDLSSYGYGMTNQNAPGITNGGNACGPTSTINSLQYLQNRMGLSGLVTNSTSNINTLGLAMGLPQGTTGGVIDQNFINGKISYLNTWNTANPDQQIHIEAMGDSITAASATNYEITGATPTMWFITQQLSAGQDVELGFNWGNGGQGGHWVTLTGMSWADNNSNQAFDAGDTATFNLLDPFGPTTGTGTAVSTIATVSAGNGSNSTGHLVLTYTGGGANNGADPDNTLAAGSGYIDIAVAESPLNGFPVPEPTTVFVVAAGAMLLLRRRPARNPPSIPALFPETEPVNVPR